MASKAAPQQYVRPEGANAGLFGRNQAEHSPTMGSLCDGTVLNFLRMKLRGNL